MHNVCTLLVVLALATSGSVFAEPGPPLGPPTPPALTPSSPVTPNEPVLAGGPRIRPQDKRIAALLLHGVQRSDTLRALVERIERGDVIVYLQTQRVLVRGLAGSLTWMAATGRFRYVRVSLNPELSMGAAIATIGHELQHVVEVADAATIVSSASLEAFYKKHGVRVGFHQTGWDTEAARVTGDEVRRELADGTRSRAAESIQAFDPRDWNVVYRRARGMLPP